MDSTPPQQTVEDELQNKQSQNTETHTSETSSQNVSSTKTQYFRIGDDFHLKEFGHLSDKRERNGQGKRTNIRSAAKSGRYLYACTNQGKRFGFRRYHPCRSAVSKNIEIKRKSNFYLFSGYPRKSKTKENGEYFGFCRRRQWFHGSQSTND